MFHARGIALLVCFLGATLPGVGARAASSTAWSGGPAEVSVVVEAAPLGPEVPADFLGLSFEVTLLDEGEFTPGHPVLAHLLRNFGPGVLRFGGSSLDRSAWAPSGTFAGATSQITADDLARMFSFAREVGWKVLLGLDLGHYDPVAAADEAETAVRVGGPTLDAVEFGNEPDLYTRARPRTAPLRPASYGLEEYLREWRGYLSAARGRVPHVPVVGPDTAGTAAGTEMMLRFVASYGSEIEYATAHHYPLGATITDRRSPRYASIVNLLAPRLLAEEQTTIRGWVRGVAPPARGLRLDETNSIFDGGKNGVSDVFAGALWTTDYLFRVARIGVIGVNLHGTLDRCGGYSPICAPSRALAQADEIRVQPNYYAALLFHHAARGRFVPVRTTGSAYVTAYASMEGDGTTRVTLINLGPAQTIVRIAAPLRYRTGSAIRLTGAALDLASGVELGGSVVNPDGTWSRKASEPVDVAGETVDLALPPTSAAAVTLVPTSEPEPHAGRDTATATLYATPAQAR